MKVISFTVIAGMVWWFIVFLGFIALMLLDTLNSVDAYNDDYTELEHSLVMYP